MVYDDFILSLQLDPVIFNPFIDRNNISSSSQDDEGDCYEFDDGFVSPPTEFKTSPDYEVKLSSETEDSSEEEPVIEEINQNKCHKCIYCQQSSDLCEGSNSYLCSKDGDLITSKSFLEYDCQYFSKNSTEDEDSAD